MHGITANNLTINGSLAEAGAKAASLADLPRLNHVKNTGMERLRTASAGRAMEEAREQAEILATALRASAVPDADFLMAHAQHLLACCREIADARLN